MGGITLSRIRSAIDKPCSLPETNHWYTSGLDFSSSSNLFASNCCFSAGVIMPNLNCSQICSISKPVRVCPSSCAFRSDKLVSSGERSFPISSKRSCAWLVSSIFLSMSNTTACRVAARIRRRYTASLWGNFLWGFRSGLTFTHSFRTGGLFGIIIHLIQTTKGRLITMGGENRRNPTNSWS